MPAFPRGSALMPMTSGQDGQALVADSTVDGGVAWATVAGSARVYADRAATLALALALVDVVKSTPTATGTYTTTVPAAGAERTVIIVQSNTTAKTMTFGTGFKPTGTLALGTTASRVFVVTFVSDGTNLYESGRTVAMVA